MRKGILVSVIAAITAFSLILLPITGYANALQNLQRQIDDIAQQERENQERQEEAQRAQEELQSQIREQQYVYEQIKKEIEAQGQRLMELQQEIAGVQLHLADVGVQKLEAEERIASRDSLLKSRVRLLYMNGSVSYMDVLLSSTSFSDFLERFHNLKTIIHKDEEILEANKLDKEAIVLQEIEIADNLAKLENLYAEQTAVALTLAKQERDREVVIASLSQEERAQEQISEEAEQALLQLVRDKQALRNRLLEEERKEEERKAAAAAAARAAAASSANQIRPAYDGGELQWPVPAGGRISSEFGMRVDPIRNVRRLHKGLDIAAPRGTTIVAADDGAVILASWVNGYGNTVVIDHDNGLVTWYAHMSAISVKEGDYVKRAQKIGEVGSTGDSTGNHLHFEVHTNAGPQNPRSYLGF